MSEEVKLSKSAKDKEKQAQDEAKLKTLETVLGKIEKTYGKGAVMNMAARPTTDVNVIPTGSINLHHPLRLGGPPRTRTSTRRSARWSLTCATTFAKKFLREDKAYG